MTSKYSINDNYFDAIDSQDKAYFLGFSYADGSLKLVDNKYKRFDLALNPKDKYIIEEFVKYTNCTFPIRDEVSKINNKSYNLCRLQIRSDGIFDGLIKQGVIVNKSYIYKYPENIPSEFIKSYMLGVFDGDGCVTGKNINIQVQVTGNQNFCEWYYNTLMFYIGIGGGVSKYSGKENVYRWRMGGFYQVEKFAKWLYKDQNLYLTRKFDKFRDSGILI